MSNTCPYCIAPIFTQSKSVHQPLALCGPTGQAERAGGYPQVPRPSLLAYAEYKEMGDGRHSSH